MLGGAPGSGGSEPAVVACRWGIGDSAAAPSIASTGALAPGTPHRNSAPAAARAGTRAHTPSANRLDGGDDVPYTGTGKPGEGVDFWEKLGNLDEGPWEVLAPRSSRLEGEHVFPSEAPSSIARASQPLLPYLKI